MKNLKVVILCGGKGTRLQEETEFRPKPLVPIGGMPIIWHIMKIYSHYGHKEFILPLGYKGDMIKEYFVDFNWRANNITLNLGTKDITAHPDHINEDWKMHFVDTGIDSGTALRLYKVRALLKDNPIFMLTYGDGIADIDINKLIDFHIKSKTVVTITGVKALSKYGILEVDGSKVTKFTEKPINEDMINGGFMVFNSDIFKYLSKEDIMLEQVDKGLLPRLAEMGEVSVYYHKGFWHCMDTYRDYLKLNELWNSDPKWKLW